ncbi:MAG: hypothetical protein IJJ33_20370, partial [Victivallales bacterium]|nr:hypothetical protein [Victivallales bacterium]
MPSLPDEHILKLAEKEDLGTLVKLDARGFLLGPGEDGPSYAARLRKLRQNTQKMSAALNATGHYQIEDLKVEAKERIPDSYFGEVEKQCRSLYGFAVDWVPGFFVNPEFFLFGGCAYCFFPEFFALFIIRRQFRQRERWFIYSRRELLAHELCHIARVALGSERFEETFAYQTSTSAFRRLLGGVFLNAGDSYLFLGSALLVLLGQMLRTFLLPIIPIWPFWTAMVCALGWLFLRYAWLRLTLSRAKATLHTVFGNRTNHVLFRCTDDEIAFLATLPHQELPDWLKRQTDLRWKLLQQYRTIP